MLQARWIKRLPIIFGVVFVGLCVLLAFYLKDFINTKEAPKKQVQQITLIKPPPPPPPPPEMKQPEVKKEQKVEEKQEEPEPAKDVAEPDPGEEPAIGEGTESGLQLGRRGKVGLGSGGGGVYAARLKAEINKAVLKDRDLRSLAYEAIVTLWVNDDGSFSKFDIEMVSGDASTKSQLARLLEDMGGIRERKPLEEKADRFRLKITSVI